MSSDHKSFIIKRFNQKRFHRKYKSQYSEMDHRGKYSVYTLFGLVCLSIISTGPAWIQAESNFLSAQKDLDFKPQLGASLHSTRTVA